jgi:hypothetical protein
MKPKASNAAMDLYNGRYTYDDLTYALNFLVA